MDSFDLKCRSYAVDPETVWFACVDGSVSASTWSRVFCGDDDNPARSPGRARPESSLSELRVGDLPERRLCQLSASCSYTATLPPHFQGNVM